jgi:hypothetical protein
MQQDISLCLQKQLVAETEIECCFQISRDYWSILEKNMENYNFLSIMEETDFCRNVKPLFVSQIEYYNLLYHAVLFKPISKQDGLKDFWIRETQRLDKFILNHRSFYDYYKSGDNSMDERYFLLGEIMEGKEKPVYGDEWVSTLLALEKYQELIKQELSNL